MWIVVRTILFQYLEHQLQIRPSEKDSHWAESLCLPEKKFSTVKTRRVHFAARTVRLFSVYLNDKIKELALLPQGTKGISD